MPAKLNLPSRFTLDRAPVRVLDFLLGVGRDPVVRGPLDSRGYSQAGHQRGCSPARIT